MIEVVAGIFRQGDHILIGKRPKDKQLGGLWEFVGGKIDPGESPQQALERECLEELGVLVRVGELYDTCTYAYPDRTMRFFFFLAEIEQGTPQPLAHEELRWADMADLLQYDFCPADDDILEKLQKEALTKG